MNIVLLLIGTILAFTALVMIERFFGKFGIVAWVCIASISANILVCKSVDFFGATCALGNVMFASTYLATDISTEKYGKAFC